MAKAKELIEFRTKATIPTGNYANIMPEIVGIGKTLDEAKDNALTQIREMHNLVGVVKFNYDKAPVVEDNSNAVKLVTKVCVASGQEVFMDEEAHKYYDANMNVLMSGSKFSGQFIKPFESEMMAGRMAQKNNVEAQDILDMWSLNAEASTSLGTAAHAALELYGRYYNLSQTLKNSVESCLHKNPILRGIVESFYEGREDEEAVYEAFVANTDMMVCGFIDRLKIVDKSKRLVRIQDYKFMPDIMKRKDILMPFKGVVDNTSLGAYWLQLSFYARILESHGYVVEGLDIFHHDGYKWNEYSEDVIDITQGLKQLGVKNV